MAGGDAILSSVAGPSLRDALASLATNIEERVTADGPRFSICTIVSDAKHYGEMLASFRSRGFVEPACEFLFVDNTAGNRFDGFQSCNLFLRFARGRYVIIVHQDVRLLNDDLTRLETVIAEITALDPAWALLGNAGGLAHGGLAIRITDPHAADQQLGGPFPRQCRSLDENFILLRADANLAASADLSGYHLYGADLCTVASILGYTAYVVDFHLQHLSAGKMSDDYVASRNAMISKYAKALRPRLVHTTCSPMALTPFRTAASLLNSGKGMTLLNALMRLRHSRRNGT